MKEQQKWLRFEDGEWQIIIPETDILPHSLTSNKEKENEVASLDCPCTPDVNFLNKILVHNSFEQKEKIAEAMKSFQ